MTILINGRLEADQIKNQIKIERESLRLRPGLAVILIGDNDASHIYVKHKQKACESVGFHSHLHALPKETTENEVLDLIATLNKDSAIHGILLQLPLPAHLDKTTLIEAIHPFKDVDGLHSVNAGRLATGNPLLVPCTPQGCLHLIKTVEPNLAGKDTLVIGCSNLVGKPMFQLLLEEDCTVTVAHLLTQDLPSICRRADIVVSATGSPHLVKKGWIKPGAIVIDVGITRQGTTIVGDVDTDAVATMAKAITPVPGGVGPMTVAYLLKNTLKAAILQA